MILKKDAVFWILVITFYLILFYFLNKIIQNINICKCTQISLRKIVSINF